MEQGTRISYEVCLLSYFSHVWFFATLWPVAHQASLSLGFTGQQYWSGLPFPSPGDLSNLGIKSVAHVSCPGRQVLYHCCHLGSSYEVWGYTVQPITLHFLDLWNSHSDMQNTCVHITTAKHLNHSIINSKSQVLSKYHLNQISKSQSLIHSESKFLSDCHPVKSDKICFQNAMVEQTQDQFSSVQSLSRVRLFVTPWIAARQASLSITISWSSLRLTSIESVIPSTHLILCRPLLLLPSIAPSIRVFSDESTLCISWPKYWSLSFSIISSKEPPGLISFRMDRLDLLAVQGTQESSPTPQFKSINSSAFSFLHSPTLTSVHDHRKNHSLD